MSWFESWFDSKYYHILYKNRNEYEAQIFITHLISHLSLTNEKKIIDIGCGKGRHSIFLNKLGFNVVGIDLSKQNIALTKKRENKTLKFYVHDMRKAFKINKFDICLNLFTSFGYFSSNKEHQETINAMALALKKDGILIIDFFNSKKIIEKLVCNEEKKIDNILFKIRREINKKNIIKSIDILDNSNSFQFQECVKSFDLEDFSNFIKNAGLTIINTFGDYRLGEFNEKESDRLVLIAKKCK